MPRNVNSYDSESVTLQKMTQAAGTRLVVASIAPILMSTMPFTPRNSYRAPRLVNPSSTWRSLVAATLLVASQGLALCQPVSAPPATGTVPTALSAASSSAGFDWREQYAYSLGVQAYLYLFPWSYMPGPRWVLTQSIEHQANRFQHVRRLENADKINGGAPNNDALYSRAWLWVGDEPVILTVPEIRDRYYTMELVDFMGDNFDYVGVRTTGAGAGNYAITGPHWHGTLPPGVKALHASSTPWAFVMGRTAVRDAADLPAVMAIQDQYRLTPLSQWGKPEASAPPQAPIWQPLDRKSDPLADWKNINRALAEVPPDPRDSELMHGFSHIGIGAGRDIEKLDPSTLRGLARAAADGFRIVNQAFASGYAQTQVNGWNYPPPAIGRPTATRDWLLRAVQMQAGFVANDPAEAMYLNVSLDSKGQPLTGESRYEVRFAPGGLPKVGAFWSVTLYNPRFNLVANPIDRYSLGDRSPLRYNNDGSLTFYLQQQNPGPDKENNWIPSPAGRFLLILRAYLPGADLLAQTWKPPAIVSVTLP